ncbi:unnamed protein product [Boreogadus saida]
MRSGGLKSVLNLISSVYSGQGLGPCRDLGLLVPCDVVSRAGLWTTMQRPRYGRALCLPAVSTLLCVLFPESERTPQARPLVGVRPWGSGQLWVRCGGAGGGSVGKTSSRTTWDVEKASVRLRVRERTLALFKHI